MLSSITVNGYGDQDVGTYSKAARTDEGKISGLHKKSKMILEHPVNNGDFNQEETELDDLIHRFLMNNTLLEQCNQGWTMLLNVLGDDSEEKEAE